MRYLNCTKFRKKTKLEMMIKKEEWRVEKQLDVRSLIMTQNLLFTMIRLFVKPKSKRDLLRIQRKHKVLNDEKMTDKSQSSSGDKKEFLIVDSDSEIKILNQLIKSM